ncbi:hypothetical protein RRF57_002095 [Xylaria bambusicola]|uniref:Uncharacterized protein n=1 Tax=Xylaria bambusicola TaxID=326684 RepID=A0AAN7U6F6_9PEZI
MLIPHNLRSSDQRVAGKAGLEISTPSQREKQRLVSDIQKAHARTGNSEIGSEHNAVLDSPASNRRTE